MIKYFIHKINDSKEITAFFNNLSDAVRFRQRLELRFPDKIFCVGQFDKSKNEKKYNIKTT